MDSKKLQELVKNEQYKEAFSGYADAAFIDINAFSNWDLYYYSKVLSKLKKYEKAIEINQTLYRKDRNFEANNNLYGWNLYHHVLRNPEVDKHRFFRAANFTVGNTMQQLYSPYEMTVFQVLKHLKDTPSTDYEEVLQWTDKIQPSLLSSAENSFFSEKLGLIKTASPLEEWYQYRINALFKTNHYEDCLEMIQQALTSLKQFHYNNDIWFQFKEAKCYAELEDDDRAIKILESLALKLPHWSIYNSLFSCYWKTGETNKATEMAAFAFLEKNGEFKHKVKLLDNFAIFLEENGHFEEALWHYSFLSEIREKNDWPIPSSLHEHIINLSQQYSVPNNIEKHIYEYWRGIKIASLNQGTGKVKSISANGKTGFISVDGGDDLYFRIKNMKQKKVQIGDLVKFIIQPSYDHKKQKESFEAVEIHIQKQ